MDTKVRFLLGLTAIVLGSLFIAGTGLLFIADIAMNEIRFSTQFEHDLNRFKTQQYLVDDFETYENTQRVNLYGFNDFSKYLSRGMIVGLT